MKKAVILDRAKRKTEKGLPLTEEEKQVLLDYKEKHEKRREYIREYMRNYRATHPEYRKRSAEQWIERKKKDPEKWRAYAREYMREYKPKYRARLALQKKQNNEPLD